MIITRFEDIESWKEARKLTNAIYGHTRQHTFTDDALRDQMRRASSSIMSNIAEGFDSGSDFEFRRYLRLARKSANELKSHTYIARDQKFMTSSACDNVYGAAETVRRLIGGFIKYLSTSARRRDRRPETGDRRPR